MSFFPPEPEPAAPAEPEMVDRLDPFSGDFPGYLGVPVSIELTPIRTDRLAITMDQFRAFPGGFKSDLVAIARPGRSLDDRPGRGRRQPGRLRVGIELSDGRRGYELKEPVEDAAFRVVDRGGSFSPFRQRRRLWVHVVPSPGSMDLIVTWAEEDLPETRLTIPTDALIDAIGRVGPVWTD